MSANQTSADQTSAGPALAVHRDVLRSVAGRLRTGLTALDAAVTRVQAAGPGISARAGGPPGDAFSGSRARAHQGCLAAARQVADAHQATAANLSDSAATYDAAESDSTRAVRAVAAS